MEAEYSDRVWTTLLWEFSQFANKELTDTSSVEDMLSHAQGFGGIKPGPREVPTPDSQTVKIVRVLAPYLFMDFIRQNSEILDPEYLIKWTESRQANYPSDNQLREAMKLLDE